MKTFKIFRNLVLPLAVIAASLYATDRIIGHDMTWPNNETYSLNSQIEGYQQPHGPRAEDDYTTTDYVQPVDYRAPQVTWNGYFIQYADNTPQSGNIKIQGD